MKVRDLIKCLSMLDENKEILVKEKSGIVLVKSTCITIKETIGLKENKYILG